MKTENHSVTLPADDYLKLLEAEKFVGLKKIEKGEPVYHAIQKFLSEGPYQAKFLMDKIEIYIKINT